MTGALQKGETWTQTHVEGRQCEETERGKGRVQAEDWGRERVLPHSPGGTGSAHTWTLNVPSRAVGK